MKRLVRYALVTIASLTALIVLAVAAFFVSINISMRDVAPSVTSARVRQVRLGMRPNEVIKILGPPLDYCIWGKGGECSMQASKSRGQTVEIPGKVKIQCFVYAREVFFHSSSTLNIWFSREGQVIGVYASKSDGFDEKYQAYSLYDGANESKIPVENQAIMRELFDSK